MKLLGLLFSVLLYLNVLSLMPDMGKSDDPVISENRPDLGSVEMNLKLNNFPGRFFEIRMKENKVPGAVIAVVQGKSILTSRGWGFGPLAFSCSGGAIKSRHRPSAKHEC